MRAVRDGDRHRRAPSAAAGGGRTLDRSAQFAAALRHDPKCPTFNPHLRQLLHVGYKVAAKMGGRYLDMLAACEATVARNVTTNLYDRHLKQDLPWPAG